MTTLNYRQIPAAVRDREAFQGNSMSGGFHSGYVSMGRLPDAERDLLRRTLADAERFGEQVYVVHSYGTPIAWALKGRELYVPDVRYSATTSRHQGIVRRTLVKVSA